MAKASAFEKGIRIVKRSALPKLQLQKDAIDLVASLFADLNAKIVARTKEEFRMNRRKPSEGITPQQAQNAVRRVVGPKLKDFAAAEGDKNVLRFRNRTLRYDERPTVESFKFETARAAATRALKPKLPGFEFFRGLGTLTSRISRDRRLDTKAKKSLASMLHSLLETLCRNIILEAKGKKEINEADVQTSIASRLTPALASHAHIEGIKAVMLYSDGVLLIPEPVGHHLHSHRRHHRVYTYHHLMEPKKEEEEKHKVERMRAALKAAMRQFSVEIGGCKLDNKAFQLVIDQLQLLGRTLSTAACGMATSEYSTEIRAHEMETAVQEMIPPGMSKFAISEGRRAVALFTTGVLEISKGRKRPGDSYSPSAKASKRPRKSREKEEDEEEENPKRRTTRKKPTELDFTVGELALLRELDCSASMDRAGGNRLNKILLDVCHKLVKGCEEKRTDRNLTASIVEKAVNSIFPSHMKDLAAVAGKKATGAADAGAGVVGAERSDGTSNDVEMVAVKGNMKASTSGDAGATGTSTDEDFKAKKIWFKRIFSKRAK